MTVVPVLVESRSGPEGSSVWTPKGGPVTATMWVGNPWVALIIHELLDDPSHNLEGDRSGYPHQSWKNFDQTSDPHQLATVLFGPSVGNCLVKVGN